MRIFLASSSEATFVKRDLEILRSAHQVSFHNLRHCNPFRWLAALPQLLGSQVVIFWFASLYTLPYLLAAVFFGKRIITIVGGYEVANRPDINYGAARGGLRRSLTRLILGASEKVLAVSEFSRAEIIENLDIAAEKVALVRHGFEDIATGSRPGQRQQVINVGAVSKITWRKKGIADFVAIAEKLPTTRFIQIGRIEISLERLWGGTLPTNVEFIGPVPFAQLPEYLEQAKVYLQLSQHESFGCSVAEAMLCRAVPVVSNSAALPEVVGDCGRQVAAGDLDAAIAAVRWALAADVEAGEQARKRILNEYSFEKRRQALLALVESLAQPRRRIGPG